jgi:hypothetical protein
MIELLILSSVVIIAMAVASVETARNARIDKANLVRAIDLERQSWRDERRFLIDRAIARHIGEVVALEREAARAAHPAGYDEDRQPRPLLEGLS